MDKQTVKSLKNHRQSIGQKIQIKSQSWSSSSFSALHVFWDLGVQLTKKNIISMYDELFKY